MTTLGGLVDGDEPTLRLALARITSRIADACGRSGRDPSEVIVVAASKEVPVEVVARAQAVGVEHFGENHASELAAKAPVVPATWHFIGKLQTGTAARVADLADVIHSGEPGRALDKVARRSAAAGRVVQCLAQVDFTGVRQGVAPEALESFLNGAAGVDGIRMVGLMTIPPLGLNPEDVRPFFVRLRQLRDGLQEAWPGLVELSMGMSGDYEVGVEEGATMVRVGTALFGARPRHRSGEGA